MIVSDKMKVCIVCNVNMFKCKMVAIVMTLLSTALSVCELPVHVATCAALPVGFKLIYSLKIRGHKVIEMNNS